MQQILGIVATALVKVSSSHRDAIQRKIKNQEREEQKRPPAAKEYDVAYTTMAGLIVFRATAS